MLMQTGGTHQKEFCSPEYALYLCGSNNATVRRGCKGICKCSKFSICVIQNFLNKRQRIMGLFFLTSHQTGHILQVSFCYFFDVLYTFIRFLYHIETWKQIKIIFDRTTTEKLLCIHFVPKKSTDHFSIKILIINITSIYLYSSSGPCRRIQYFFCFS